MFRTKANVCVTFTTERKGLPGTNAAMILTPGPYCVGDRHDVKAEEIPAKHCRTPLLALNGIPKDARLSLSKDDKSGDVIVKVTRPSGSCILEWVFSHPNKQHEHILYRQLLRHTT